jgi:hypothetical protein
MLARKQDGKLSSPCSECTVSFYVHTGGNDIYNMCTYICTNDIYNIVQKAASLNYLELLIRLGKMLGKKTR